jgi:IS605 OrfB family transposase
LQDKGAIGIDLGCKTAVTCSDGTQLEGRHYRKAQAALRVAQRAGKKARARALHAKVRNTRQDGLHKLSTHLVQQNSKIFVGDVSSQKLVKTKMAKSVLDAGWSTFKTMLEYKSHQARIVFQEVNESYTSQACSSCGDIPSSSPKGRAGLGIREWTCSSCNSVHNRDVNAARNILRRGLSTLDQGALA